MGPREALDDLRGLSTEIEAAVILDDDAAVLASTLDDERAREVARTARGLLETADGVRRRPEPRVTEVEVAMRAGSVFVVREAGRTIVASTAPDPTTGLVLYDLKSCLLSIEADGPPA